jgi:flagellar biosynthesis chaperone FliJ
MKRVFFVSLSIVILLIVLSSVKIQISGLEREIKQKNDELDNIKNQLDRSNRIYADKADSEKIINEMQQYHQMEHVDNKNIIPFKINNGRENHEAK